uniref:Uncharacterized protein n=1 Tax=Arundo donax TaxID=35708 RepID=A0A0A8ZSM1_ARUDO
MRSSHLIVFFTL